MDWEARAGTRRDLLSGGARLVAGGMAGGMLLDGADAAPAAAAALGPPAFPETPPLGRVDYWAFADWIFSQRFDRQWSEHAGSYGFDTRLNAALLLTHAIAALDGHSGPARQDRRAVRLATELCRTPPFRPGLRSRSSGPSNPRAPSQRHTPGWVASMRVLHSQQNISIDSKVAQGLVFAWRARGIIGLPTAIARLIEDRIIGTASGRFFRYPAIRLNQVNWAAELYEYAYELSGRRDFMTVQYRRQLSRFLRGSRRHLAPWEIPNLGPSYNYHRAPFQHVHSPENVESAEYANICLEVIQRHRVARRAGMAPLSAAELRTLRAWISRALAAYWTHAGYLNWDTGLYRRRWHLGRYWAFSLQGLLAIVLATDLRTSEEGSWAKWIFDRAFYTYRRMAQAPGHGRVVPASPLFAVPQGFSTNQDMFAARFMFQAALAVYHGLDRMAAAEPPPLYAFDPTIGRLAVTTPTYNTAIVNVSNGAFPYGGIGPARLFDADQHVLGGTGGRAPAGFGVVVRDQRGRIVAASQRVRARQGPFPPLVLERSPRGRIAAVARYPAPPYAGRFTELRASGVVNQHGVRIQATTTFRADNLEIAYALSRKGRASHPVDATFPTWGTAASVTAVLGDGSQVALTGKRTVRLDQVDHFFCRSIEPGAGYVVVVRKRPAGAIARITRPPAQDSNPKPGPSLTIRLASARSWKRLGLDAVIAPAADSAAASAAAARLRG